MILKVTCNNTNLVILTNMVLPFYLTFNFYNRKTKN
jgi:hypothetical protein